jgi:hypothetical protein
VDSVRLSRLFPNMPFTVTAFLANPILAKVVCEHMHASETGWPASTPRPTGVGRGVGWFCDSVRQAARRCVRDNTQEGFLDLKSATVVLNEAEFPEFVHEKVDSGARCADHLRQRFL